MKELTLTNLATVKDSIDNLARVQFGDSGLRRVDLEQDLDSDGDQILRVIVVLDKPRALLREKLVGFQRLIFDQIWEDIAAFPVVVFRSVEDDKDVASEAA